MKSNLIEFIKYHKLFFRLYVCFYNSFLRILKLFIHVQKDTILFVNVGGRSYNDNPRAIFEFIKKDKRFEGCTLIWGFREPEKFSIDAEKVKVHSLKWYIAALKAGVWITNSGVEYGLHYKQKETFFINMNHGFPIKKAGLLVQSQQINITNEFSSYDIFGVSCEFDAKIKEVSGIPKEIIRVVGAPRNDILVNTTESLRDSARRKLGISEGKKVILYAPTYREWKFSNLEGTMFSMPFDFEQWKNRLGDEYVVLFLAHYAIIKIMRFADSEFVKNVSDYPDINDILVASDMLVSDYSGIIFDFSFTGRPIICFPYDYTEYKEKRGFSLDVTEIFPYAEEESELLELIINADGYAHISKEFNDKYAEYKGIATLYVADMLASVIGG